MFSQACVKNSVHRGILSPLADTPPLGRHPPWQTPHRADPPWADIPWQTHPPGRHPPSGHCSGRYASYWNAFLYFTITALSLLVLPTQYADCHSILDHILD